MSESDNITRNLLGKLLRTEVSIIRSYRAFLMLLPIHVFFVSIRVSTLATPSIWRRIWDND